MYGVTLCDSVSYFETSIKIRFKPYLKFVLAIQIRDEVLKDVLENKFQSPWPRRLSPWPWPLGLKSSKIALSSARKQHYFWTVEIFLENARNLVENLRRPFLVSSIGDRLKKIFEGVYFFWRLPEKIFQHLFLFFENTCVHFFTRIQLFWELLRHKIGIMSSGKRSRSRTSKSLTQSQEVNSK